MLIEFTVRNFLSFKNSTTLSMERGERLRKFKKTNTFEKNGYSLLKNIIAFGANGSGKSNLFLGLDVFQDLVLEPTSDIEEPLRYLPFKLDTKSEKLPTEFSVKFIKDNSVFTYSIAYDSDKIHSEELLVSDEFGRDRLYFKRNSDRKCEAIPKELSNNREQLRENRLFLFEAQDRNDKICGKVFSWFKSNLVFWSSKDKSLFKILKEDENTKELFIKLLNLADFNIIDIEIEEKVAEVPEGMQSFMAMISNVTNETIDIPKKITGIDVKSVYKKYDYDGNVVGTQKISYGMESSGTQKMMNLALLMIYSQHQEKVLLMDEFDDSFHLSLTKAVISIINSSANDSQFLFTSHNLNLMDCNLRVDQIYFTEKKFTGETELYSIFDFNDINGASRSDITFLKRYLNGLFGGLPDIETEEIEKLFEEF